MNWDKVKFWAVMMVGVLGVLWVVFGGKPEKVERSARIVVGWPLPVKDGYDLDSPNAIVAGGMVTLIDPKHRGGLAVTGGTHGAEWYSADIMKRAEILNKVSERIEKDMKQQFITPYDKWWWLMEGGSATEVLKRNRSVEMGMVGVKIKYKHPDRFVAAKVANMFVEEMLAQLIAEEPERIRAMNEYWDSALPRHEQRVRELRERLREPREEISSDEERKLRQELVQQERWLDGLKKNKDGTPQMRMLQIIELAKP